MNVYIVGKARRPRPRPRPRPKPEVKVVIAGIKWCTRVRGRRQCGPRRYLEIFLPILYCRLKIYNIIPSI